MNSDIIPCTSCILFPLCKSKIEEYNKKFLLTGKGCFTVPQTIIHDCKIINQYIYSNINKGWIHSVSKKIELDNFYGMMIIKIKR